MGREGEREGERQKGRGEERKRHKGMEEEGVIVKSLTLHQSLLQCQSHYYNLFCLAVRGVGVLCAPLTSTSALQPMS